MLSSPKRNPAIYLLALLIFTTAFCSFTFKSYEVIHLEVPSNAIQDTTPVTIELIDTITIFDYETTNETVSIVKSQVPLEEYLSALTFSGVNTIQIDTLELFDFNDLSKSTLIQELTFPDELSYLNSKLRYDTFITLVERYGQYNITSFKGKTKASISLGGYGHPKMFTNDKPILLNITDLSTGLTSTKNIQPVDNDILISSLDLPKGNYRLTHSYQSKPLLLELVE